MPPATIIMMPTHSTETMVAATTLNSAMTPAITRMIAEADQPAPAQFELRRAAPRLWDGD